MGNLQTVQHKNHRRPIFDRSPSHNKNRNNSRTPPNNSYSRLNQIYIFPEDIKKVIKDPNSNKKSFSPFQGSRYRYDRPKHTYQQKKFARNDVNSNLSVSPQHRPMFRSLYKNNGDALRMNMTYRDVNDSCYVNKYPQNMSKSSILRPHSQINHHPIKDYYPYTNKNTKNKVIFQYKNSPNNTPYNKNSYENSNIYSNSPHGYNNSFEGDNNNQDYLINTSNQMNFCMDGQPFSPIDNNHHKVGLQPFKILRNDGIQETTKTQRKNHHHVHPSVEQPPSSLYADIYEQNRQKCHEIIKKVRNFNDFLNQIKRKVKYQQENYHKTSTNKQFSFQQAKKQAKKSNKSAKKQANKQSKNQVKKSKIQNGSYNHTSNQSHQISMIFKLQNEKMQLEKYRKLIERQLSKQQSIESITIEDKQNTNKKQKIIRIHYDAKYTQHKNNIIESESQYSRNRKEEESSNIQNILNQNEITSQNSGYSKMLNNKYKEVSFKLNQLGKVIKQKQQNFDEQLEDTTSHQNIKKQNKKINKKQSHRKQLRYEQICEEQTLKKVNIPVKTNPIKNRMNNISMLMNKLERIQQSGQQNIYHLNQDAQSTKRKKSSRRFIITESDDY